MQESIAWPSCHLGAQNLTCITGSHKLDTKKAQYSTVSGVQYSTDNHTAHDGCTAISTTRGQTHTPSQPSIYCRALPHRCGSRYAASAPTSTTACSHHRGRACVAEGGAICSACPHGQTTLLRLLRRRRRAVTGCQTAAAGGTVSSPSCMACAFSGGPPPLKPSPACQSRTQWP